MEKPPISRFRSPAGVASASAFHPFLRARVWSRTAVWRRISAPSPVAPVFPLPLHAFGLFGKLYFLPSDTILCVLSNGPELNFTK